MLNSPRHSIFNATAQVTLQNHTCLTLLIQFFKNLHHVVIKICCKQTCDLQVLRPDYDIAHLLYIGNKDAKFEP